MAVKTILSGLSEPHDSRLKKNFFGFPCKSYGACANKNSLSQKKLNLKSQFDLKLRSSKYSDSLRMEYSERGHSFGIG